MTTEEFYPIFLKAEKIVIDSRKIAQNDIFFAFSGDNFGAATVADKAIEQGTLAVIVENKDYNNPEKNIFYTASALAFLQ